MKITKGSRAHEKTTQEEEFLECSFEELLNLYEMAESNPEKVSKELASFVQGGLEREIPASRFGGTGGGVCIFLSSMERQDMVQYFKSLRYSYQSTTDLNSIEERYSEKNLEPFETEPDFIATNIISDELDDFIQVYRRYRESYGERKHVEIRAGFSRKCTIDVLRYIKEKIWSAISPTYIQHPRSGEILKVASGYIIIFA